MDLDSDMNATPLAKLAPAVQSRADQGRADPPNYADLLTNMDVQPGRVPGLGTQHAQHAPPADDADDADGDDGYAQAMQMQHAAQYAQYMNQQPMYAPTPPVHHAPPPPPPPRAPRRRRGIAGFLRQNRDALIVAAVAFAMLQYGAPRLRMIPGMTGPGGGLNSLGLGLLAAMIGFSTRINGWV